MINFHDLLEHCRKVQVTESAITTQITDMNNKLLGVLVEDEKMIEIRTPMGQALGRYIKASNTTTDMMNKALAKGNILMTLLK